MPKIESEITSKWHGLKPVISICCITYNQERFIEEALVSFLSQTCDVPFEIIVGEDCSTDSTRLIVRRYVENYPRIIKLITSNVNIGGQKNFNRVVDAAKGEYIAVCEGDDYFKNEFKLQKSYEYMKLNPDVSMLFTPALRVEETTVTDVVRNRYTHDQINKIDLDWVLKKGGGFYPTPTSFFKSKILKDRPTWFESHCAGDYPMAIAATLNGKIGYLDEITACYRVNLGSMSNPDFNSRVQSKIKFGNNRKKNLEFFREIKALNIIDDHMYCYLVAKEDYIYYAKLLASGYQFSALIGVFRIRGAAYFKLRLLFKSMALLVGLRK